MSDITTGRRRYLTSRQLIVIAAITALLIVAVARCQANRRDVAPPVTAWRAPACDQPHPGWQCGTPTATFR